jgi:hypothetical protein
MDSQKETGNLAETHIGEPSRDGRIEGAEYERPGPSEPAA